MNQNEIVDELGIDSIHFVASIKVIQAGNILAAIDFTKLNELKSAKVTEKPEKARAFKFVEI